MSSSTVRAALVTAAAACATLLAPASPPATAAPTFDARGYLDSTARCPEAAVLFGSTETSRVAICTSSGGEYQYRGVRVRDGARLVTSASRSGDGTFVAVSDGITYTVSASSLVVSAGQRVLRSESWVDFHGSATSKSPTGSTTPTTTTPSTPATSATSTPTTSATATSTPSSTTPTSATPLPPPLPAEVGGNGR